MGELSQMDNALTREAKLSMEMGATDVDIATLGHCHCMVAATADGSCRTTLQMVCYGSWLELVPL